MQGNKNKRNKKLMNITDDTIYVHNGTPLVHTQINDKISGFLPAIHTKLAEEPRLTVNVGKMTLSQWRSVVTFFTQVNKKEKSEAQVRLFYSDEKQNWKIWAFPQKSNTGMTTSELPDDEEWNVQWNAVTENGVYYQWGTIHSHCNAGAFASSTDKDDEANNPGIHITIGHLDKEIIDLDIRFTLICPGGPNKSAHVSQQKVNVFDFIDIDNCINQYLTDEAPACVRNYARTMTLKANTADHADSGLIEQWTKNRRENKPTPTKYFFDRDTIDGEHYYGKSYTPLSQPETYKDLCNDYPLHFIRNAANPEKNKYKVKHKKLPAKNVKVWTAGPQKIENQQLVTD